MYCLHQRTCKAGVLAVVLLVFNSASANAANHRPDCPAQSANARQLSQLARALVAPGKGLLAADESTATMGKRFSTVGVVNTLHNRTRWRQALLTTPDLPHYISGVIMTQETLFQLLDPTLPGTNSSIWADLLDNYSPGDYMTGLDKNLIELGRLPPRLTDLVISRGVMVGVKVDEGLEPIVSDSNTEGPAEGPFETQTTGLDGIHSRCAMFAAAGATFAKWRAVFHINEARGWPSPTAISTNAAQLATYAAAAQAAGLVPVVEPEVLLLQPAAGTRGGTSCDGSSGDGSGDGSNGGSSGGSSSHASGACGGCSLQLAEAVSQRVMMAVISALQQQPGVVLEGLLIKPAMVLPADACSGSSGSSSGSSSGGSSGSGNTGSTSGTGSSGSTGGGTGSCTLPTEQLEGNTARHQQQQQHCRLAAAAATLRVLRRTVPPAVAGIAFLSGGQSEADAAANLAALNSLAAQQPQPPRQQQKQQQQQQPHLQPQQQGCTPWALTFSFGRALQASALAAWAADPDDVQRVQQEFSRVAARAAAAAAGATLNDSVTACK